MRFDPGTQILARRLAENMNALAIIFSIILAGCAASPQALESVGKAESARLAPPAKRLSSYADYELKAMVLSPGVQSDPRKVKVAGDLENTLQAKLQPLLNQWKVTTSSGQSGKLVIEPHLVALRVVSSGARFLAGALVGDSSIDLDLVITDQTTGQQVAKPRVMRSADSVVGGLSIGKSDQNLLDYIASIAYQYLKDNH